MSTSQNNLGDKIVLNMPGGLIFCVIWTNARLDENVLKITISDDQRSVEQSQAKPLPENASELLSEYKWGTETEHFVYKQVEAELGKLKKAVNDTKNCLDERVLPFFVNHLGEEDNGIDSS